MTRRVRRVAYALPALVLLLVAGCGPATGPGAGPATGPEQPSPTGARTALDPAVPNCVAPPSSTPAVATGRPEQITIPALGVVARVVPVGLTDGRLVPPADPTVVGWWRGGAEPGATRGTAVLTGHTVSGGGGVFDDLPDLRRGDEVLLRTTRGDLEYRVLEVAYYPKAELARLSDRLFSQSTAGRLVLSTCSNFDGQAYLGNTLAFAALETPRAAP